MDRVIALVDMDCFYVQVEQRLHPETKGLPCAVVQYKKWKGGGIIAVGYEARAKGVTRNMWGEDAEAKCPDIHFFRVPEVRGKADLTKFREAGAEVIAVLSKFSHCVERASVDEAYIDLTEEVKKRMTTTDSHDVLEQLPNTFVVGWGDDKDGSKRKQGVGDWMKLLPCSGSTDNTDQKLLIGALIAEEMRAAVYKETGFSCSAGIAINKMCILFGQEDPFIFLQVTFPPNMAYCVDMSRMLAKLACGLHKPNKQTILPQSSVQQLFETLPITKIRNLGGKLGQAVIEQLSIQNIGQLCQFELHTLQQNFGDKTGAWLYGVCRGIEHEPVSARQLPKSIGCSKNFPGKTCLDTKEKVKFWLLELSKEVEERLVKDRELNNRLAKSMTVSVRYLGDPSPVVASRACAISRYDAEKFANDAYALIMKLNNAPAHQSAWSPAILCLGVSATKFQEESSNQSTLNMSSFVGQKALCSGSVSPSQASPASQIKPKTKTIDSFFLRGHDTQTETDHLVNIEGQGQDSTECEKVDSSVNYSYRSTKSANDENSKDQNVSQLSEEKVLTAECSTVRPDPIINGRKGNVKGFFARVNYQHESVSILPRETTLVESQKQEKTDSPGRSAMELNGVNFSMKKGSVISQNSVDPDYLAALPADIRQEVLSQLGGVTSSPVDNPCTAPRAQEQKDRTSLEKFLTRQDSSVLYSEDSQDMQNLVTCDKCNKQVEKSELAEHLDFHFAKELQKELTWTSDKSSEQRKRPMERGDTSSQKVVTKRLKNNAGQTQTISHFFNKKSS